MPNTTTVDTTYKSASRPASQTRELAPLDERETQPDVVSKAKQALVHVAEEGRELLSELRSDAVDAYDAGRERLHTQATALARRGRTVGLASRSFVGTHALPLAFVGASLGWLAWSIRQESLRAAPRLSRQDYRVDREPVRPNTLQSLQPRAQLGTPVAPELSNTRLHTADTRNPEWDSYVPEGHGRTDEQIRADVHAVLRSGAGQDQTLSVSVSQGVVTLSGRLQDPSRADALVRQVRAVASVSDVKNQLQS